MDLSRLLSAISSLPPFLKAVEALGQPGSSRHALLPAAVPAVIAAIANTTARPTFVLTARTERAKMLAEQAAAWFAEPGRVFLLPEPDGLPYERYLADPLTIQGRLRALWALRSTDPPSLVIASVQAVLPWTLPPEQLARSTTIIRHGSKIRVEALLAGLVAMGYEPVTTVSLPGTFARRGGIIDLYSPASDSPVRIELFGDEVESLRQFETGSQRSKALVEEVTVGPARERLPTDPLPPLDLSGLDRSAKDRMMHDLGRLNAGQTVESLDFYSGLLPASSPFEHLGDQAVLVVEDLRDVQLAARGLVDQAEAMRADLIQRGEIPADFPAPHVSLGVLDQRLANASRRLLLDLWHEDSEPWLPFQTLETYSGRLRQFLADAQRMRSEGRPVVITSYQHARLGELLDERGIGSRLEIGPNVPRPGEVVLIDGTVSEGWSLAGGLVLFSDREVFGLAKPRGLARPRPTSEPGRTSALLLADIKPGDYVVHIEHGIGRFTGLTTRDTDEGAAREYLVIDYAEGDRLFVPTDHIDRVARYIGGHDEAPKLTRLHSGEWQASRARVKRAVRDIARDLLRIYAARIITAGQACSPDTIWQRELEDSFPYVETPDQLVAIAETKFDMEQSRPMDRIICGDVGYGKTEVAVRAAFKAVQEGTQVAMLVPTTILAQQHFETFKERLAAFPVRIEVLSRFRSPKDQDRIVESLRNGDIDVVIGTHRLIQKDVAFKNLGLVVVDEEQRFGVTHKETLKKLRTEVDVLTLTATPIPRTLHMALTGVRDLSTIDTPPENRLPIRTTVAEYNESLVRQAILREIDRDGQIFFVHNRVFSIDVVATKLRELVPEARILIAHGQMPEDQLEHVMAEFAAGKADILVCTTIIESGLDLPNVNTIIVSDSDRYGLAQLYQLRGRVGRGANRAFAYFLYPADRRLTEIARQRLQTIFEASDLGSGYRVAMRDLEIRGAGNLLGAEQSGHIGAVGFDLYTRLLAEAVEEMKASLEGRQVRPHLTLAGPDGPSIDLKLPAYLPNDYIEDTPSRLLLYQRLVAARRTEEVEDLAQEMRDRFGDLPVPVRNLLYVATLRVMATVAGVTAISARDEEVIVQVEDGRVLNRSALSASLGQGAHVGNSQIRLSRRKPRWTETLKGTIQLLATG